MCIRDSFLYWLNCTRPLLTIAGKTFNIFHGIPAANLLLLYSVVYSNGTMFQRSPTHVLTGENKSKIDKIWDAFWSGGISDPLRVIEQISFLLFIKRLDDIHTAREKQANRLNKPIKEPIFGAGQDHLRWSRFRE